MANTLKRKTPRTIGNLQVIPPWPMEEALERVEHPQNPFRTEHGLEGKFVVMYSGNHSVAHPLDTLVKAALELKDDERIRFLFIGGGQGKYLVEQAIRDSGATNITSLPYQPIDRIKFSLSAADVHVVALGQDMVGIVHPCKFYGAMAIGKPFILLGPGESHVGDVLEEHDCGWTIQHGDVAGAVSLLRRLSTLPEADLLRKGQNGRLAVEEKFSRSKLCNQVIGIVSQEHS
jgi:hypothetical protein